MNHLARDVYESFVLSLPSDLRPWARDLPALVGAAPPDGPKRTWTDILAHAAIWATPLTLVEGLAGGAASADDVRHATLAHMLGLLVAIAKDRVDSGTVRPDLELERILERARRGRDHAWTALARPAADERSAYAIATRDTLRAMTRARHLTDRGDAVDFAEYESLCRGKWTVAFPASLALIRAAKGPEHLPKTKRVLGALWLALQVLEDALSWEQAFASGGAWPVLLARPLEVGPRIVDPARVRAHVNASGVVLSMLSVARIRLEETAEQSRELDLLQLSLFAMNRASYVRKLMDAELTSAGGALRAHALASWAARVL